MGLSASPVGRRSRCMVNEAPQLGHRGRPERMREGGHPAHSRVIALECATTQGHHGALGHRTKRPPGSPAGRGIQLGIPPENRQLFVWRSHQDLVRNAPRNNWQSTPAGPSGDLWAETNLFDEAVLHDPGGPEHSKPAAYPPPRLRIEEVSIVGGVIPRTPQNRRRDD